MRILVSWLLLSLIEAYLTSNLKWNIYNRSLLRRNVRKKEFDDETIHSLHSLMDRIVLRFNETDPFSKISLPKDYSSAEGLIARTQSVRFQADAFTSSKLEYLRRVYFTGGGYNVFNLVILPKSHVDLPILGIDIVILPGEILATVDFQPLGSLEHDIYLKNKVKLSKWKVLLPFGGKLPEGSESFFSPYGLWTRFPIEKTKAKLLFVEQAANEFSEIYSTALSNINGNVVTMTDAEIQERKERVQRYLDYRRESDPAKRMLIAAFGKEWTSTVLSEIIFPLSYKKKG